MRKNSYTKEQIDYIREIGDMTGRTNKEITEMFNKKFNTNKTTSNIINIKCRNGIKSYTRNYTRKQIEYLRKITPGRNYKEIQKLFNEKFNDNRTIDSISSKTYEYGIKTGNDGRFKKGNRPYNYHPVGTERIND